LCLLLLRLQNRRGRDVSICRLYDCKNCTKENIGYAHSALIQFLRPRVNVRSRSSKLWFFDNRIDQIANFLRRKGRSTDSKRTRRRGIAGRSRRFWQAFFVRKVKPCWCTPAPPQPFTFVTVEIVNQQIR
jgi:hypothetical protein